MYTKHVWIDSHSAFCVSYIYCCMEHIYCEYSAYKLCNGMRRRQREYTPLNTRMPYNIVLDRLAVKATTDDDATT